MTSSAFTSLTVHPHHIKQSICGSRATYRDGRKETAVRVYTVNQESIYLLISNVPAIGGGEELRALCDQYGIVEDFRPLDDYPCEEFTEVYLAKYQSFRAARSAKKLLDDRSFLGGTLHVCYAPEFESVIETKLKLQERRKYVAWKTKSGRCVSSSFHNSSIPGHIKSYSGNAASSNSTVNNETQCQPVTYVWAGKEYTVFPKPSVSSTEVPKAAQKQTLLSSFVPRQVKCKTDSVENSVFSNTINHGETSFSNIESHKSMQNVDDSSYLNTISHVRSKISNVSVPNVRVSLKRKRRL